VSATNLVGESGVSVPGYGAVILTNPEPPSSLTNKAAETNAAVISMTWTAPTVVGGTPVIDYRVSWDQGGSTYAVLATGITTT